MSGHLTAHVNQSCRAREEEVWEKGPRYEIQRDEAYTWAGSQSRCNSGVKLTTQPSTNNRTRKIDKGCDTSKTPKIPIKWETFLMWPEHSPDATPSPDFPGKVLMSSSCSLVYRTPAIFGAPDPSWQRCRAIIWPVPLDSPNWHTPPSQWLCNQSKLRSFLTKTSL